MPRRHKPARALGPYKHGHQWRVIVVDGGGQRTFRDYPEERLAAEVIRSFNREVGGKAALSVDQALAAYETYLRDVKQNRETSIATTMCRLRGFFVERTVSVASLEEAECAALYQASASSSKPDTHRNTLSEAKTFLKWCVRNQHARSNPLDAIEGVGRRRKGKPQLRIDEARRWISIALARAESEPGAVAALVSLLMGLRASEIIQRQIRDLDDEGSVLSIPLSKTEAGRRTVEVPAALRPLLWRLAEGREGSALLFGSHWRDWVRHWVQRICVEAGVPKVSAHAMRGLHSSLALERGVSAHEVARALGHDSPAVTRAHYATQESQDTAKQGAALKVLRGGKS